MKSVYPVIFTELKDEKDTVLVEVPDLSIYTEGYGIADEIEMARDAMGFAGITLEDMDSEIPKPRDMEEIDLTETDFEYAGNIDAEDGFVVNLRIYGIGYEQTKTIKIHKYMRYDLFTICDTIIMAKNAGVKEIDTHA